MSKEVTITIDEQHAHWRKAVVGEHTYLLEVQEHNDGNFDVVVFEGEEVKSGSRVATFSTQDDHCILSPRPREGGVTPYFFDKHVLKDMLLILDKMFENSPYKTISF